MEFFNSLNLKQIKGGTKLKQGDLGSVLSYSLTDENGQEITSFDNKTAYINLVLDDKIWFTTTTLVDISRVTFRIDKAIPIGLYYLEIKIDDYIFPSDRDSIILIEEGSTPYDLKELVPNYDVNMTLKGILSDLSQKGIDISDLNAQLAQKANKDEVTNVITPKGTLAYASLPTSGNQVGWYYYCPDGDGVHGAGNYVWNGTSWFFGGTGDEGYNLLKKDIDDVDTRLSESISEIWDTNIAYGRTWEQGSYVDDTFDSEKTNVDSRIRCLIELDSAFTKMSIKIGSGFLYYYRLYDENKNKVAGSYDYSSNEIERINIANAKYIRLLVMKPNNQVIKPYEAQNANIVISIDGDKRSMKEVSDGIKSLDEGYNLLKKDVKDLVDVDTRLSDSITEIWDTNIAYGRTWEQGSYVDDTFDSEKTNVTSRIRCLIELGSAFTEMSIKIESGFLYHYSLYDENKNKVAGSYDYSSNEIERKNIANAKYIRLLVMKPNNQAIKPYEAQNANIVISIDGDKRSIKEVSDGVKSLSEYSALHNPEISDLGKIEKDNTISPVNLFNVSELVDGWRVNADGTESPNDDESVTGYIKCSYGDTIYTFRTYPNAETLSPLTPVYVSEYNGNKEFIKRSGQYPTNGNKGQYNVTDKNTRYIRIEAPKDVFSSYRYSIIVNWDGTNKYTEYFTPYSVINTVIDKNKPKTVKVMSYNLGKWSYGVGGGYEDTSTLFEKLKTTRRFFGKINADIVGMQEKRNGFDKDNTINANTEIIEHWYPYFATRDATKLTWDVPEIRSKYKIVDGGYGKLSTDRNYTYGYVELYGKRVFLLNVHLDPFSAEKRATERAEVLQILADKKWFIMTGDFNAIDGESEYADWVSQGYNIANGGFFGNYITTHGVEQMIDNIITSNNIRIDNVEVHSEAYDMCSSDHLPIVADLTLLF